MRIIKYKSENHFRKAFLKGVLKRGYVINKKVQVGKYILEYDHGNGRADIVFYNKSNITAIEVKLSKWESAIYQAYRSSSYAHYVYVVIPYLNVNILLNIKKHFLKRGVGLCVYNNGVLTELIKPQKNKILFSNPLKHVFDKRAYASISANSKRIL